MSEKPIVVLSGGFDPLHSGHIDMFREAENIGHIVVLLNSDAWLRRKKGKEFMSWDNRATVVSPLRGVIEVMPFDDSDGTCVDGLRRVKELYRGRDIIFANGGDRVEGTTPETDFCQKTNIQLKWNIGGGKTESSSSLLSNWVGENAERDWGRWLVLKSYSPSKVKELYVEPGKTLSYQRHEYRHEHWFVIQGTATVVLDDQEYIVRQNKTIEIPKGSWHQLCNYGENPLIVLEVQYGERCVETDIERKPRPE